MIDDKNKKCIVLGVSGGIAAYKACELIRLLIKNDFDVHCILTKSGSEFITPLTLQTLTGNIVYTELFSLIEEKKVNHISLADKADVLAVIPATANIIAKTHAGICDDLLSTVICATKAPVVFAPAMNVNMWENPITKRNIQNISDLGFHFIYPEEGELACGYSGVGRLANIDTIFDKIKSLAK